jgi:hypothetical protein
MSGNTVGRYNLVSDGLRDEKQSMTFVARLRNLGLLVTSIPSVRHQGRCRRSAGMLSAIWGCRVRPAQRFGVCTVSLLRCGMFSLGSRSEAFVLYDIQRLFNFIRTVQYLGLLHLGKGKEISLPPERYTKARSLRCSRPGRNQTRLRMFLIFAPDLTPQPLFVAESHTTSCFGCCAAGIC